MVNTILEVNNINKTFANVKAVQGVSFSVKEGEILGLLGPNGAGKTTVIRMIMGIFEPDTGHIKFDKRFDIDKKKIGYLPEERGIYDSTNVLDTILYFADLKGMNLKLARSEAMKWLEILELKDFASSKIEKLSKGMQQKVQFIISILHKPKLIVFDEVFSGLDPVNQDLFKDIILQLSDKGATILLSSHRMNMVEELCDRIFMINQGQRVLYGELDKIKNNIGQKKVKLTVAGNADIFKEYADIEDLSIDSNEVSFRFAVDIKPQKFIEKLPKGIEIEEISILKPSLHEIFVAKVKGGNNNE